MRRGAGFEEEAEAGRKRLRFMGVPVVEDWWVSLRMRPPKLAMVEFVVNGIVSF